MRIHWLSILAGLFLATAAACTPGGANTIVPSETVKLSNTIVPIKSEGVVAGSVMIGPICPVEPCTQEIGDTYSSRQLQLQSESASGILVPLRSDGTFRASVPVGEYVVTVSNCDFLGCSTSLPVTVVITDGETSDLRIDIDTGIRSVARAETSYARLIDDLRGAGADVAPDSDIIRPFFGVTGQVLTVNGNDVQVFEFPSVDAAQAEAAKVAPDGSSIGASMVNWVASPHFYSSGSLIVLYVGDDENVQFLLADSLGHQFAGLVSTARGQDEVSAGADVTARRELSSRLGVATEDLSLVRSQETEHGSGGLGCPDAGALYTEAVVPGYVLLYELNGLRYP